jgi:predicted nucleic acid-binding protein
MAMIYLLDTSAWSQLRLVAAARTRFTELLRTNEVATCPVAAGELLYSARSQAQLREQRRQLEKLLWLETTNDAQERVLALQDDLARRGHHRSVGVVDLLVAATAEAHWATVLHYDGDFERIAQLTGQPQEWIVPRGEGHGVGQKGGAGPKAADGPES